MLINTQTHQRIDELSFRALHPNTSFPAELTDEILSDFDLAILHYPDLPVPAEGEKVVADGFEQIDGQWRAKYAVVAFSEAEVEHHAAMVRQQRNERLRECDWTQAKDIPESVSNQWTAYRQALRDLTLQSGFPFGVQWPVSPLES